AWVSPNDNSVRVTFDRKVFIEPHFLPDAPIAMTNPVQLFADAVILELKFTNRFPNWFNSMVHTFNLMWSASAKYAGGVFFMGEHRFHDGERTHEWEVAKPGEFGYGLHSSQISAGEMELMHVYE